jgi:hypothetical protein
VIGLVLVVALPGQDHAELELRIGRVGIALLGRNRALAEDVEVAAVLGRADVHVEALVRLVVHDRVGLRVGAEHVLAHSVPEQRLRVLLDVDHRAIVRGPRDGGLDVGNRVRQGLAGR